MKRHLLLLTLGLVSAVMLFGSTGQTSSRDRYWIKAGAHTQKERSLIADTGVAIDHVSDDFVIATGTFEEHQKLQALGLVDVSFPLTPKMMDFPSEDAIFHNYSEIMEALAQLARRKHIVEVSSLGQSLEGREIPVIRISTDLERAHEKPAVIFMGGHHAREHLSIEIPLMLAQHLVREFETGNSRVVKLLSSREVHIIPVVNPDGAEHDITGGQYKMWRKNRRQNKGGSVGVDLNRNYSYKWATGGSSPSGHSDTYHGPTPFSEPETQAIKSYVESHINITTLLSFHTYSELILYPWGHSYDSIGVERDKKVHELMAQRMSKWNNYIPQQSSDLYITSGDTTDWSYGEHGIISFTFELDPRQSWGGRGFYPGAHKIPTTFQKNLEPSLFLIEYADNPYRILEEESQHAYSAAL